MIPIIPNWLRTHTFYIVFIVVTGIFFHLWVKEHDARLAAEANIKQSQNIVKSLQDNITQVIATANTQKQVIIKEVQNTKTPQQAILEIPDLSTIPLNARSVINDPTGVTVDATALFQELATFRETSIDLGACQAQLKDTQNINIQKDAQIKQLKKGTGFLHKFYSVSKDIGIGLVVGLAIKKF